MVASETWLHNCRINMPVAINQNVVNPNSMKPCVLAIPKATAHGCKTSSGAVQGVYHAATIDERFISVLEEFFVSGFISLPKIAE